MISIFIPTRGRVHKQSTLARMPKELRDQATVVCPPDELTQHEDLGRSVLVCPDPGISATRDFIMYHAAAEDIKYIAMLDDDVVLQRRREDFRITNVKDDNEYILAVLWLEEQLDNGYAHCGWGTRFLAYAAKGTEISPGRMMYCLAYDVEKVMKLGATFSKGLKWDSTMEDFNMTLQLLRAGEENVVSLVWRASPGPSNAPGGCSTWRTTACQSESAQRLAEMYPEFVKLRRKKQWEGMEEGMMDVTIQWRKAWRSTSATSTRH
jgi:hypothetical protein